MTALARTLLFTLACTTLSGIPAAARASSWQDNALSYVHGTEFTEPGNRREVRKDIVQFTHASGYALGQNFFSLKVLRSDATDPKKGSSRGATEGYLVYRHQLHLGKAFERSFAFGPVKEVALSAGFDLNTKDTAFSPRKRVVVVGPTFKFDVPGYLDLSLMVGKEWNRCRLGAPICPQREIGFDPQWMVNVVVGHPVPRRRGAAAVRGLPRHQRREGAGLRRHEDRHRDPDARRADGRCRSDGLGPEEVPARRRRLRILAQQVRQPDLSRPDARSRASTPTRPRCSSPGISERACPSPAPRRRPRPCPVCLDPAPRPFMAVDGREYWRCEACEATFLAPAQRPAPADERAEYLLHANDPQDAGYRRFLFRLAEPLLARLAPACEGLDYGCGPGPALAAMLREAGHDVALYDPFFAPDARGARAPLRLHHLHRGGRAFP